MTGRRESAGVDPVEGRAPRDDRQPVAEAGTGGAAPGEAMAANAAPEDASPALPPGALVAMRKSGGLVFRSREIVVYGDGRVERGTLGGGRPATADQRTASAAQLAALRRAVGRIDLARTPPPARPGPDAFVYEIALPTDAGVREIVVADGQIPETIRPLLRELGRLLAER
jgi:hypothetical protein